MSRDDVVLELAELWGVRMEVQLFTRKGDLVATVTVRLDDGRVPDSVRYDGVIYALIQGRYVEVSVVNPEARVA